MTSPKTRSHASWRTIGGQKHYFKSSWEVQFALFLQWQCDNKLILKWTYEPKTFWFTKIKRGTVSYKPDFWVEDLAGRHYWLEVKGYMDAKSNTKIKRFRKYFPEESLIVVDKTWFKTNPMFLHYRSADQEIEECKKDCDF